MTFAIRIFLLLSLLRATISFNARHFAFLGRNGRCLSERSTRCSHSTRRSTLLASSGSDGGSDGEGALDAMRNLLESSWNSQSMGTVPSSPEAAAREASEAILAASSGGIYAVQLLLPSYDLSQGKQLYDEVRAVEFCIALSQCLEGKTEIAVRDAKTLQIVNRIFNARERDAARRAAEEEDDDDYDEEDEEEDDEEEEPKYEGENEDNKGEKETGDTSTMSEVEFYDDFADLGGVGSFAENDTPSESSTDPFIDSNKSSDETTDVDAFRKQLMMGWKDTSEDEETNETPVSSSKADKPKSDSKKKEKRASNSTPPPPSPKCHRLVSLFGDVDFFPRGPDLEDHVVAAVKANAKPLDEEDTVIVLSADSPEETVALRALATTGKRLVLVNCRVGAPVPRELRSTIVCYSVLPLVAKSERNLFGIESESNNPPQRVVLRRYPRDWEVYVDANDGGFQLAATAPAASTPRDGPGMQWIAERVKEYLQTNA